MLMCFPLKIDAENAGVLTTAAGPYPAAVSADRAESDAPDVVRSLAAAARAARWQVRIQWARGSLPHATTGRPGRAEDSWAVRFARDDGDRRWGAWALRRGAGWPFIWVWGSELLPFGMCGMTDLKAWLADPDRPQQWYADIRERVRAAQERAKEAARTRPKKAREGAT